MRWTFDLASQLEAGRLTVLEQRGVANLIFVDDLVECALLMLDSLAPGTFFVTDDSPVPWSQYLDTHAQGLGYPAPPRCPAPPRAARGLLNALAGSGRSLRRVLASDSFRQFLTEDPLARATLFRLYLWTRDFGPVKRTRNNLQNARSLGAIPEASAQWLTLQTSQARLSSARLKQTTGFHASWSFERGAEASIQWLRRRGY